MDHLRAHSYSLSTSRLRLRPMTESDWPTLLKWNQDRRVLVSWDSGNTEPWTLSKLQTVYRGLSRHAFMFMILFEGKLVGETWIKEMNLPELLSAFPGKNLRRIDLSIGRTELWGRGFGTEVIECLVRFGFDELVADAIFACHVSDDNPASRRAFEKNGFVDLGATRAEGGPGSDATTKHLMLERSRWTSPKP